MLVSKQAAAVIGRAVCAGKEDAKRRHIAHLIFVGLLHLHPCRWDTRHRNFWTEIAQVRSAVL